MHKSTSNKQPKNQLLEFSGMAFEMLIIVGIFAFVGNFIDKKIIFKIPLFTIVLCLIGLVISFYQIIKRLQKK